MKKTIILLSLFILFSPCNTTAATLNFSTTESTWNNLANTPSLCADIIETKYRLYNGVVQYRRWNSTKQCWVDSSWRNL